MAPPAAIFLFLGIKQNNLFPAILFFKQRILFQGFSFRGIVFLGDFIKQRIIFVFQFFSKIGNIYFFLKKEKKVLRGNFFCGKLRRGKKAPTPPMKKEQVIAALATRARGTFATITVNRAAKVRKAFEAVDLRKESKIQFQIGVDYANRRPVREAVESGEREAPELPAYVASVETVDGVKLWHHTNGNISLPLPQGGNGATRSQWLLGGQPVEESEIAGMLLASELKTKQNKEETEAKGQAMFNTIKLENIVSIA